MHAPVGTPSGSDDVNGFGTQAVAFFYIHGILQFVLIA
jgi:hypothetical protein